MAANTTTKTNQPKRKFELHHLKHPFMVPVFTFLVLFFLSMIVFIAQGGQTVGANDSRIVELTINDHTQVIPTNAPTVGDLLDRLKVQINKGDVVEPATSTPILENNFQVSIYHVHPVTVIENGQKTVIETAVNDPKAIAKEAGYKIYPQDNVTAVNNADNLGQGVLGQEVNIDPAVPVTLNLYGTQVTERTHAKTVSELLASDNIKTNSGNNVLPSLDTPVSPNLNVLVVPVGQHLISTQQVIPFATQTINSATVPYGVTQVQQTGANGLALVVEDIDSKTGQPVNQLQHVVITQPVTQIVVHGTGITAIAGGNNITWLKSSDIGVSDYSYVNVIMIRETHWNPDDVNGSGCIGLGQSCGSPPGLAVVCPDWQNNAVCQLNFFNSYATSHWGSWAAAASHENAYGWW